MTSSTGSREAEPMSDEMLSTLAEIAGMDTSDLLAALSDPMLTELRDHPQTYTAGVLIAACRGALHRSREAVDLLTKALAVVTLSTLPDDQLDALIARRSTEGEEK